VRGANGRRVSRGRFRVVGCGALRLDFDSGLGGEAEETVLFLPVMRQVLAQPQQPARRQLDGMSACEESGGGFDGGLGGEVENMSLFAPVVRQVLAQSQEPRRRELDRLTALKQRAHNIRRQIGQSHEGG
jgi:hypothetical protein